jgi:peptide/nickel transport system substrate-binding protein
MKKIHLFVSWLLLGVMVLTACTPKATQAPQTQAPATEPTATTVSSGETGFVELPRNETVIFENIDGRVAVPDNFNPYISGQYLDWGFWQANQESLFYENLETGKNDPWIAESATFNADNTEVTIKIRNGVTWQK